MPLAQTVAVPRRGWNQVPLSRRQYLALLGVHVATAAERSLVDKWRRIASATDGVVGAAALHVESGQGASLNGQSRFPLASVCKLPIAMRLLSMVDEGHLQLEKEIEVLPRDRVAGKCR